MNQHELDPSVQSLLADDAVDVKAAIQETALKDYIMGVITPWREFKNTHYVPAWRRYERSYLGMYAAEDATRDTERSRLLTPLTAQAVESAVDEVNEAVFGAGHWFDLEDNTGDPQIRQIVEQNKAELTKRFKKDDWKSAIEDVLITSAVYGSGFGVLEDMELKYVEPGMQQTPDGQIAVGVYEKKRWQVKLKSVEPYNVLVDWHARSLEDSRGVALEEYWRPTTVSRRMAKGLYRAKPVAAQQMKEDLRSQIVKNQAGDGVLVVRYWGLVPESLIGDPKDYDPAKADSSELVEAVVHIINDEYVVLAEKSPYMDQKRCVVHFPFSRYPGRLVGRGIPEKGENMQRAADATIRSHMDSLAVVAHPVTITDATRMPKGMNTKIYPGRNIMVNGPTEGAIQRLDLGQVDPALVNTEQLFERLFVQATGTMDSSALPDLLKGGTDPMALQMALAGFIKKNRRLVSSFQEKFLIPSIECAAMHYMQFEPDTFIAMPYEFNATGSIGLLEREYNEGRYIKLLQTLGPQSPLVPALLSRVLRTSALPDREALAAQMEQMAQQMMNDPAKQQQMQQQLQQMQLEQAKFMAEIEKVRASVALTLSQAEHTKVKTMLEPRRAEADIIGAISKNIRDAAPPDEFERRIKMAGVFLEERKLDEMAEERASNERITMEQMGRATQQAQASGQDLTPLFEAFEGMKQGQSRLEQLIAAPEEVIRDENGNIKGKRKVLPTEGTE